MRLFLMGLMVGCFGVAGCGRGPDIRAMCEAEVACEGGGTDLDVEACVAVEEIDADYMDDIGCGAEYDAYVTCVEPYLICNLGIPGEKCTTNTDCRHAQICAYGQCTYGGYGESGDGWDKCEAERNAYHRCHPEGGFP